MTVLVVYNNNDDDDDDVMYSCSIRPSSFHGQPDLLELFLQAPVLVHGHQNVASAQELAADKDLRNSRPVGEGFDPFRKASDANTFLDAYGTP